MAMSEAGLILVLEELESSAQVLQKSLLSRDTEQIWGALAKQEASVDKLNRMQLSFGHELMDLATSNTQVRGLLGRSRSVLQTNRALTQTFLSVIDETLDRLSGKGSCREVYSMGGQKVRRSTPCLVSQQG
jgi:hypothetical protein